jgi:CheY-like chemotaxis protein
MCVGPIDARVAPRVLVAEDNPINAEVISGFLAAGGYVCDVVEDGLAAIAAVASGQYDIVLMDIQMPVVDGLMATKQIRALGGRAEVIPIIAVTAPRAEVDAAFLSLAGLDAWITKPVDREQLYVVMEGLIAAALGRDPA